MIIMVWLSLALLTVLLVYLLLGTRNPADPPDRERRSRESTPGAMPRTRIPGKRDRPCPLCGTMLQKGETVHSVLYPGKPDSMMYIYGCPFCYTDHPRGSGYENRQPEGPRQCPACKEVLREEDYVIARVFEKPEKTHVHVLGCTICR